MSFLKPIRIGEVFTRFIGRTIVKCFKTDLKILGGDQQLCICQKGGIEQAIPSLRVAFKNTDSEAFFIIDAKTLLIYSIVILLENT